MLRIRYRKLPESELHRSTRNLISSLSYAAYYVILDKKNKKYSIYKEDFPGTPDVLVSEGSSISLPYLQQKIREDLVKLGIPVESEKRKE